MESGKTPLLQAVLSWPLQQVTAWLDGLAIGEPVEGEYFNWELLAFTAAARAHEERSLPWARIALTVYGLDTLSIETLRKLRDIKNALKVLSLMTETSVLPRHRELERWLQLKLKLP